MESAAERFWELLGAEASEESDGAIKRLLALYPQLAAERAPGAGGLGPMELAAGAGRTEVVRALLEAGAPAEGSDRRPGPGPLMVAARRADFGSARLLLAAGAAVDREDASGWSALDHALGYEEEADAQQEKEKIRPVVRLLLDSGARADDWQRANGSALDWAAQAGLAVSLEEILKTPGISLRSPGSEKNALMHAAAGGKAECLRMLLSAGSWDLSQKWEPGGGQCALSMAAGSGSGECVRMLLDAGADLEERDDKERTPLMCAAQAGHSGAAAVLLAAGADVHARDYAGMEPLMFAAMFASIGNVGLLLDAGADASCEMGSGESRKSAAYLVLQAGRGGVALEMLLKAGASPETRTGTGISLLMAAVRSRNMEAAEALLAHGADPNARNPAGGYMDGHPTLMGYAAAQGMAAMAELLERAGASMGKGDWLLAKESAQKNGVRHALAYIEARELRMDLQSRIASVEARAFPSKRML